MIGKAVKTDTVVTVTTKIDVEAHEGFEFTCRYRNGAFESAQLVPKEPIPILEKLKLEGLMWWYLVDDHDMLLIQTIRYGEDWPSGSELPRNQINNEDRVLDLCRRKDLTVVGYNGYHGKWFRANGYPMPFATMATYGSKRWKLNKLKAHLTTLGVLRDVTDIERNMVGLNHDSQGTELYCPVILVSQEMLDKTLEAIGFPDKNGCTNYKQYYEGDYGSYLLDHHDPLGIKRFSKKHKY